jgi:hypothetical protein
MLCRKHGNLADDAHESFLPLLIRHKDAIQRTAIAASVTAE